MFSGVVLVSVLPCIHKLGSRSSNFAVFMSLSVRIWEQHGHYSDVLYFIAQSVFVPDLLLHQYIP